MIRIGLALLALAALLPFGVLALAPDYTFWTVVPSTLLGMVAGAVIAAGFIDWMYR